MAGRRAGRNPGAVAVESGGHDSPAIGAEPLFGFAPGGEEFGDHGPEAVGMVHLAEVGEFVGDDVVPDVKGDLNEAPVEGDGAFAGAGAPAGALVPDLNVAEGELVDGSGLEHQRGQFGGGEAAEVVFDRGAPVHVGGWEREGEVGDAGVVGAGGDRDELAAEPDLGSRAPGAVCGWRPGMGEALELGADPGFLFEGETTGEGLVAASGNGQEHRAVTGDAEDVASCAGVATEDEGDADALGRRGLW